MGLVWSLISNSIQTIVADFAISVIDAVLFFLMLLALAVVTVFLFWLIVAIGRGLVARCSRGARYRPV
uniref:Envelope protein n=1 Tax=Equine arteritis virus TaxID=11047 RepID=V9IS78_EAV|nr:E envelope protein [Equine arteritis virus]AFM56301.1 E envelope protein [Equine arteritis virus]AFM56308.1 E envelope protein [Equine arteritis virus]AFM56504.1 E envelope protein [Equine arteritis virus]AYF58714.1 envelope protein [Equine arteritis virus]